MVQELVVKNLSELTTLEFDALRALTVSEHQEILGKSFRESIDSHRFDTWVENCHALATAWFWASRISISGWSAERTVA